MKKPWPRTHVGAATVSDRTVVAATRTSVAARPSDVLPYIFFTDVHLFPPTIS